MVKVAFIGAGSVEFTRNVVTDLCGYPELGGELHLALHDVSATRLAAEVRLENRACVSDSFLSPPSETNLSPQIHS